MKFFRSKKYLLVICTLFLCVFLIGAYQYRSERNDFSQLCANESRELTDLCYSSVINKTLKSRGLTAALDLTATLVDSDKDFALNCHNSMHELGKAAYVLFQSPEKINVTDKVSYCNFGFYHAFIEEMLVKTGGVAEAKAFCDLVGSEVENQTNAISNCYHGIGHGISSEPTTRGDASVMAEPGLAICRKISENNEYKRSCAMGVFNSIELLYRNPDYKLDLPNNAYALCRNSSYSVDEKEACYLQMTLLSKYLLHDLDKELEAALAVESPHEEFAIRSVALYATGVPLSPQEVVDRCRATVGRYIDSCITGVAVGFKIRGAPADEYQSAIEFYKKANLSASEKYLFLYTLLTTDVSTQAEQQAVCKKFPIELRIPSCTT